jgi:hypothetical protein
MLSSTMLLASNSCCLFLSFRTLSAADWFASAA